MCQRVCARQSCSSVSRQQQIISEWRWFSVALTCFVWSLGGSVAHWEQVLVTSTLRCCFVCHLNTVRAENVHFSSMQFVHTMFCNQPVLFLPHYISFLTPPDSQIDAESPTRLAAGGVNSSSQSNVTSVLSWRYFPSWLMMLMPNRRLSCRWIVNSCLVMKERTKSCDDTWLPVIYMQLGLLYVNLCLQPAALQQLSSWLWWSWFVKLQTQFVTIVYLINGCMNLIVYMYFKVSDIVWAQVHRLKAVIMSFWDIYWIQCLTISP